MSAFKVSGVSSGAYGSATAVATFTVNQFGNVTVAGNTTITLNGLTVSPATVNAGTQFSGPSGAAVGSPAFNFQGDLTTGIYHPSAGAIGFSSVGVGLWVMNASGHFLVGQTADNGNGYPLQVQSTTITGCEATGYGGSGAFYARLGAGTAGSPTPATTAQIARFGLRGIDTAGSSTFSLGGNLEITPTGTWSASDHGVTVALWSTPAGSTTRSAVLTIDSVQNTTIANTTKGAFQAAGTATTCTGATIGTGSKANAGFVTATTTGVSTVVVTFPFTAATGWAISPTNNTTANLTRQTASSTTTATFSGTTVTGDVISYVAMAY